MSKTKKIVFLYTRLPDYFYSCILYFLESNKEYTAVVIRYPKDSSAPFELKQTNRMKLLNKSEFEKDTDLLEYLNTLKVEAIFCTGWKDKMYLKIISKLKDKCPVILGLDNPWENTPRQIVGVLYYYFFLKKKFTHVWVSGMPQYEFAKRLGFDKSQILNELYCANTPLFSKSAENTTKLKEINFPKKLVFIGRYVKYKQPLLLVKLFKDLEDLGLTNGWSLELIGDGPLKESLNKYKSDTIKINSFISPSKLPEKLSSSGAFCLPSKSEHWGVVVHEAAAAGLPLLLSNTTYAGTSFLINGYNGFNFNENKSLEFKQSLLDLFQTPESKLLIMGKNSAKLAERINHNTWSANLMSILNK